MKTEEILKRNKTEKQILLFDEKLTFDDILLVPQYSELESIDREISEKGIVGSYIFSVPIISAAMTTVTEERMVRAMLDIGGGALHHRYNIPFEALARISTFSPIAVSPSMGKSFLRYLVEEYHGDRYSTIALDVAHGHRREVLDYAEYAVKLGIEVWSGNIVTVEAARAYLDIGVNILKLGIGPGSACSTRTVSGCGYPQASAIWEIKQAFPEATIVSDGGIKSSGDIVKALALGADAVIIGGLLAGTAEAPGEVIAIENKETKEIEYFKEYSGMASREVLEKAGKTVRVEGVSGLVPYVGPVKGVIDELMEGVKLGMAYVGARNIKELQEKAQFVKITQAGQIEGSPRI